MLPNLYYVHKYADLPYDVLGILIKPLLATAGMGVALHFLRKVLPYSRVMTVVLVLAAIVVFAAVAIAVGAMTQADLAPFTRRFRRKPATPKKPS